MSEIALAAPVRVQITALQKATESIEETQLRLASGLRVRSAVQDSPAFFTARSLKESAGQFQTVKDTINQSIQIVDSAIKALEAIENVLLQMRGVAQAAISTDSANGRAELAGDYNDLRGEIIDIALGATVDEFNLLVPTDTVVSSTTNTVTTGAVSAAFADSDIASVVADLPGVTDISLSGPGLDNLDSADSLSFQTIDLGLVRVVQVVAATVAGIAIPSLPALDTVTKGDSGGFSIGSGADQIDVAFTTDSAAGSGGPSVLSVTESTGGETASVSSSQVVTSTGNAANLNVTLNGEVLASQNSHQVKGLSNREFLTIIGSAAVASGSDASAWGQSGTDGTAAITATLSAVDEALTAVRSSIETFGNDASFLGFRESFSESLVQRLQGRARDIVDADLDAEAANLLALQTRRQLGGVPIGIANTSNDALTRLAA